MVEAMRSTFSQIIHMRDDDIFGFGKGDYFSLKNARSSKSKDDSQDELLPGEDFHNPMFDAKFVHPLGRFNQTF